MKHSATPPKIQKKGDLQLDIRIDCLPLRAAVLKAGRATTNRKSANFEKPIL